MSYLVLARKWRPQTFSDLVGQDHVARTLGNAIAQNRVAHAFLFTGVRGVGKTTSARILAKALNCFKGPTAEPCLQCSACKEITAGVDTDVQEIDGATNNGVDEIRRIQEYLPYQPARDRFKILIIDEVHMLSSSAWNAFLKTLEEPPPHVKFIFATTEVNKVPITILSRCQRYDFKMISAQRIAARVRYILEQEKIVADDSAVQIVSREAAGSMRDALSILDQVIAFGGDSLVGDEVARVLGVADRQALHDLASAIVGGKAADALRGIDALANGGFDLVHVARDLLRRFRDLTVARIVDGSDDLLDLADAELADVRSLAASASADDLARIFQGMSRALDEIARSGTPRAALEMTAVRLAHRPHLLPVDALIDRIAELEKRLGAPSGPGGGGATRGAPGGSGSASTRSPSPFSHADASGSRIESRPSMRSTPPTMSVAASNAAPVVTAPVGPIAEIVNAAGRVVQPDDLLQGDKLAIARRVVDALKSERSTWGAFIDNGIVVRADEGGFEIAYEKRSFLAAQVTDRNVATALERAARSVLGAPARIVLTDLPVTGVTLAQLAGREKTAALDAARRAILARRVVQDVITLFGADVREVKLPPDEA